MSHMITYGPAQSPAKHALMGIRYVEGEGGAAPAVPPAEPAPPAEPPAQEDKTDWKSEARKWEQRAKENTTKLEKLEQQSKTEAEKALDAAREEGRSEVRTVLARERVSNALTRALTGRVPDTAALLDLDRSQFIKGDAADVDAITAWVNAHSTEAAKQETPKKVDRSQGVRNTVAGTQDAGRAAYERLHPKPTT